MILQNAPSSTHKKTVAHFSNRWSELISSEHTEKIDDFHTMVHSYVCTKCDLKHNQAWWTKPKKSSSTFQLWLTKERHTVIFILCRLITRVRLALLLTLLMNGNIRKRLRINFKLQQSCKIQTTVTLAVLGSHLASLYSWLTRVPKSINKSGVQQGARLEPILKIPETSRVLC